MDSGDESIDSEIKVNEEIDPEEAAKEVVHHNIDEEFKSKEAKNLVKGIIFFLLLKQNDEIIKLNKKRFLLGSNIRVDCRWFSVPDWNEFKYRIQNLFR